MLLRQRPMWTRGEAIGLVACFALIPRYSHAAEGDVAGAGARPVPANPLASDIPTDELRRVPGVLGDVGKSLESLPGVSRPGFGIGAPIVWGAEAGDTRVLVDGMEIPMLYHLGGFRSVVGSAMVDSVALLPGGYGADLGRAVGGVVNLETRSPPPPGYFGDLDANVFDASFAAGAGFAGGGVAVGGRSSYLGRITSEAPTDAPWMSQNLRYRDLQAKALFALRPGETIELIGLYSSDYENPDYTFVSSATFPIREQSFLRLGARYTRSLADGGSVVVTPFVGSERSRASPYDPAHIHAEDSLSSKDVGLRVFYRQPFTRSLTLQLGFDGLVTRSNLYRLGDHYSPAREGDIVLWGAQSILGNVVQDGWAVTMGNLAPSATLELATGKWRLIPSFRADLEVISGDKDPATGGSLERVRASRLLGAPAPRLLVSHQSTRRVRSHVAIGLYHQAPSPGDMSSLFGSPQLGLSHAMHVVAGTSVALVPGLTLEGTAFYRQLWALVTRNPNPLPPFGESLVQDGQGRVWGAELLVHFTSSILSGWLSYTFSRSERRQSSSAPFRLFDYDQTHVLSAVAMASYAGFSLGARLRVASGMPRTPVTGAYFSASIVTYEPIFGPQNSERLPTFSSLDLRVEKIFRVKRFAVTPYFEGINLTNRKNTEDYAYSPDFSQRAMVTGLPMTLVAGVALKF
jgi:hypothetical protein